MAGLTITIDLNAEAWAIAAVIDEGLLEAWLQERLDDARNFFISAASGPSPSAPGAYPGLRSGALVGSVSVEAAGRSGSISAGVDYAGFLASGTSRMAPRKMLADALDETLTARPEAEKLAEAVRFEGG